MQQLNESVCGQVQMKALLGKIARKTVQENNERWQGKRGRGCGQLEFSLMGSHVAHT